MIRFVVLQALAEDARQVVQRLCTPRVKRKRFVHPEFHRSLVALGVVAAPDLEVFVPALFHPATERDAFLKHRDRVVKPAHVLQALAEVVMLSLLHY